MRLLLPLWACVGIAAALRGPLLNAPDAMVSAAGRRGVFTPIRPVYDETTRHGAFLPPSTARLVSGRSRQALSFILSYLESRELEHVKVMISGGFVRDLLLGRMSDDLDLTLDLRSCAPEVSVDSIAEGIPAYAATRAEVDAAEIVTTMSAASRSKSVDAAQVKLRIGGEDVLIDLMPTIASEVYDAHDRIPKREGRGTAEQDALRRDLTIGALLLEVVRAGDFGAASPAAPLRAMPWATPPAAASARAANELEAMRQRLMKELAGQRLIQEVVAAPEEAVATPAIERLDLGCAHTDGSRLFERRTGGVVVPTNAPPSADARPSADAPPSIDALLSVDSLPGLDALRPLPAGAAKVRFRLLDFHGGLHDLQRGVLRAPYPRELDLEGVWEALALSVEERAACETAIAQAEQPQLAAMGHDPRCSSWSGGNEVRDGAADGAVAGVAGAAGDGAAAGDEEERKQTLWWIKCLRDDPLRIVRTLRFAATLGFRVHPAFWRAVPFATDALRSKISGPRKMSELCKIAKAGMPHVLDFYELAFSPLATFGEDVAFGDALFGGPPPERGAAPARLSVTTGFNGAQMRAIAGSLPDDASADARLGGVLAAAVLSCDLRRTGQYVCGLGGECVLAGPPEHLGYSAGDAAARDEQMRACLVLSVAEVERACAGLCASAEMRQAAEEPLNIAMSLLQPLPPANGQHEIFAAAAAAAVAATATRGRLEASPVVAASAASASAASAAASAAAALAAAAAASAATSEVASAAAAAASAEATDLWTAADFTAEFTGSLRMWELLKFDPALAKRRLSVGPRFVLALLRTRTAPGTMRQLERRARTLSRPGPRVSGRAVSELAEVPPHLRGIFIAQVHALARMRGDAPSALETGAQLRAYLDGDCEGLLQKLCTEWYEEPGGALRAQYHKAARVR